MTVLHFFLVCYSLAIFGQCYVPCCQYANGPALAREWQVCDDDRLRCVMPTPAPVQISPGRVLYRSGTEEGGEGAVFVDPDPNFLWGDPSVNPYLVRSILRRERP